MKELNCKCPLTLSLGVIGGKWKPIIIYNLDQSAKRFGELDAIIEGISRKVLTTQLNELVQDKLIVRTAFSETPPRVEYSLTIKGKELIPIFRDISNWGGYLIEDLKAL